MMVWSWRAWHGGSFTFRLRLPAARRDVRDGDEPELFDGLGCSYPHRQVFVPEEGHVDLRPGRDERGGLGETDDVLLFSGDLEGVALDETFGRLGRRCGVCHGEWSFPLPGVRRCSLQQFYLWA